MTKEEKISICKVVAHTILVDGHFTDSEMDYLVKLMEKYELTPEEQKDVKKRNIDEDVTLLADGIESEEARNELFKEIKALSMADGDEAPQENNIAVKIRKHWGIEE